MSDIWILVANGERGDQLDWSPEFTALRDVRDLFQDFAERGLLNEDSLADFIVANPYFRDLGAWGFPPLSDEMEFGELSGFLPLDGDDVDARYSIDCEQPFQLFVDADMKQEIIEHFDELISWLRDIEGKEN